MPQTRIGSNQIRIDPYEILKRSGLDIEESLSIHDPTGWEDTLVYNKSKEYLEKNISLIKKFGEDAFFVLKKFLSIDGNPIEGGVASGSSILVGREKLISEFIKHDIIKKEGNKLLLVCDKGKMGATFECFVARAMDDIEIQTMREVKVVYPFFSDGKKYDPDGAKYDVLGGLDWTKIIWVECKKPIAKFKGGNPSCLGDVLSGKNIDKFHKRCLYFRPDIAIYLVDTKDDYIDKLSTLLEGRNYQTDYYRNNDLNQIITCLDRHIYFCRIDYSSNGDWYESLQKTIKQVLYDFRRNNSKIIFEEK